MSNFRCRIRDAAKVLATHPGEIKYRLHSAIIDELLLADVPETEDIPSYFREGLKVILSKVSTRSWSKNSQGDRVRATLHGKHGKTLSKIANEIWVLHNEYEEYLSSGFIPGPDT